MLSIVQDIKTTTTPPRGSEKGFLLSCPDLKSSFSAEHRASPLEPRIHCPGHSWPGNGHPSSVATPPSELIPVGEPEAGGTYVAHAMGACEEAGAMQDIPLGSRQHSPLHEAPEPGQAADEPLGGVNLLQEVTGEVLDDGLHV